MTRKTIPVDYVTKKANHLLALPDNDMPALLKGMTADQAFRLGVLCAAEAALHETGNYKGFNYLKSEWAPTVNGVPDGLRDHYDETRRFYYL